MTWDLIHGDCLEVMAKMPDASVDAVVTDPPYGLGFMGKAWDALPPGEIVAKELLRIAKPGAHLVAFGGTRTYHRLACALEDAGWEIRDCLAWLYGSGFPKSLDVSKAIDKAAGAERPIVGDGPFASRRPRGIGASVAHGDYGDAAGHPLTAPSTDAAREWQGWGTALKPAHEPIVLARKPLAGTVAANVERFGTGALNVDGCRVGTSGATTRGDTAKNRLSPSGAFTTGHDIIAISAGRWPPNVLLGHAACCGDECGPCCPVGMLDEQSGESVTPARVTRGQSRGTAADFTPRTELQSATCHGDSGTASRFFPRFKYVAKASSGERNAGLDGLECRRSGAYGDFAGDGRGRQTEHMPAANHHPTVKPIELMRWLCRLVTPPGGTVLDPFAGSGTTLIAATREGFNAIGIEREGEYVEIARRRIEEDAPLFNRVSPDAA